MEMGYASIAMSLASGYAARATAAAQAKVNRAQADAANVVREGQNVQKAAEGSLARFMQSENNNRRLKAAGNQLAAGTQTLMRQRDANVTGSIERQLHEAEAAGAYAANAASTGTAGNAVDMIDLTMRLKNSRQQQSIEKNQGFVDYDTLQQILGIMPQTVAGLDRVSYSDGMDFSKNLSYTPPTTGNAIFDIVQSPGFSSVMQSLAPKGTATAGANLQLGKSTEGFSFKAPASTSSLYSLT
jgi:hypothetical protein